MIKNILITFCFLSIPFTSKAQFFSFGFGDDFFGPQIQGQMEEAEYDGTKLEMEKFLKENFKNPEKQRNVNGTIIVECIINEKGEVVETHLLRGVKDAFNKEARRVASLMQFKEVKKDKEKNRKDNDTRSYRNQREIHRIYNVSFPIKNGKLNFLNLRTIEV